MKISAVKTAYAIIVLCGVIYAFIVLRGPGGIPGLIERRREVREYEQANQQLHREIEEKQERIERLRQNPTEQEFEIRRRLKFAKPGEKIYIIDDKSR
ncbi:MAG: septum formation initiator family protein [Bryobacteraceae bacterium]|jgi:cell division protein FtsB